jgi:hypothetical protein
LESGADLPGRGAWLCQGSADCLAAARRNKAFDRALRAVVDATAFERLAESGGLGTTPSPVCEDGMLTEGGEMVRSARREGTLR